MTAMQKRIRGMELLLRASALLLPLFSSAELQSVADAEHHFLSLSLSESEQIHKTGTEI
jgi:hypothetical protein